jgi:uncharacterized membrane protein
MVSQLMIPFMAIIVVIAVVVVAIISSRGGKDYLTTTTTTTTRCRGYYYCHGSDDWPCQSTLHIYYVWHRRALPSPQSRHRLAALLHGCFYCYYYTATILFLAISLVLYCHLALLLPRFRRANLWSFSGLFVHGLYCLCGRKLAGGG